MNNLTKCPFCAEDIQEKAILCKHCKSEIKKVPSPVGKGNHCKICKNVLTGENIGGICPSCSEITYEKDSDKLVKYVNTSHKKTVREYISSIFLFIRASIMLAFIAFTVAFFILTKEPETGIDCSESGWVNSPSGTKWSDLLYQNCEKRRKAKIKSIKALEH